MLYFRRSDRPTTSRRRWRIEAREGAVVIADAQTAGRGRRGPHVVFAAGQRACTCRSCSRPARARVDPDARDDAADAGGRRRARRRRRGGDRPARRPQVAERSARRPAQARRHSRRRRRRRATRVVLGYGINVGATAYPPELRDRATSLESELGRARRSRRVARRDARRARRAATTICSTAGSMLFSTPGAAARRRSRGARVAWTTPAGAQSGVTAGIDDAARCWCGSAIASSGSSPEKSYVDSDT